MSASERTITWLHPNADGGFDVESVMQDLNIAVSVTTSDGTTVLSSADLEAAGWKWVGGYWENIDKSIPTERLNIHVSGLPLGKHEVYLRFFEMPQRRYDNWWYFPTMYFGEDLNTTAQIFPEAKRIISGTGIPDWDNIYDASIGIVGAVEREADAFVAGFNKYRWAALNRYGSIRIESELNMDVSTTLANTAVNMEIRNALLGNGAADGSYGMGVVSPTLKVRPKSFDSLVGRQIGAGVEIAAARGEYGSSQVVIHSAVQNLDDVILEWSSLNSDEGDVIDASAIQFSPVGYVPVEVPHVVSEHGWWPEPILTFLNTFSVNLGDVQSMRYQVYVPDTSRAGIYRGTLSVKPGNAPPVEVPVSLRVWGFDMPKMPYLRVVMGLNMIDHSSFLMDYGINPTSIYASAGVFGLERTLALATLEQWKNQGAKAVNLGYVNLRPRDPITNEPTVPDQQALDDLAGKIRGHYDLAVEAGLGDACYIYLYDEAESVWIPAMQAVADRLRAEFPNLLLLTTASLRDEPQLSSIDGWCPLAKKMIDNVSAELNSQNRELWWYTANTPPRPFPNLFLTGSATAHRQLLGFLSFASGVDGFLYYAAQGNRVRNIKITTGPYTDIGTNLTDRDSDDWMYLNGPGGLSTPLPSMRLEAISAGLYDYNYLYIARAVRDELRARGLDTGTLQTMGAALEQYDTPGNDVVIDNTGENLTDFVTDPDRLDSVKHDLGLYIERGILALGESEFSLVEDFPDPAGIDGNILRLTGQNPLNPGMEIGDPISYWADLSGRQDIAVVSGTPRQVVSSKFGPLVKTINFEGEGASAGLSMDRLLSGPFTLFILFAPREVGQAEDRSILSSGANAENGSFEIIQGGSGGNHKDRFKLLGRDAVGDDVVLDFGLVVEDPVLLSLTYDGEMAEAHRFGRLVDSSTELKPFIGHMLLAQSFKASAFFKGEISDILLYDRVLETSEVEAVIYDLAQYRLNFNRVPMHFLDGDLLEIGIGSVPNLVYRVESSPDLVNWVETDVIKSTGSSVHFKVGVGDNSFFLRVRLLGN